jgi:hypothetical protein
MTERERTLPDYFGDELMQRVEAATDLTRTKELLEAIPELEFQQFFNRAFEIIYREQIIRDMARLTGKSSIPPADMEPMVDLDQFGVSLVAMMIGQQRGLTADPRLRRRIEREMLVMAMEFGAMRDGKLIEMKLRAE